MKNKVPLCAWLVLLAASPASYGCSCLIGEDKRQSFIETVDEATYVFFAKVGPVTHQNIGPVRLKDTASIVIRTHYKGFLPLSAIEATGCARGPVSGEERIFFVDKNYEIMPCTESFNLFFESSVIIEMLEEIRNKNAN